MTTIDDRNLATQAVAINGDALMKCSIALKNDKQLVLLAVTTSVDALLWASPQLKEDKDVLLQACTHFGRAIRYTQQLRSDKDVVIAAVTNDGNALQHVPTASGFKDNIDIVKIAISNQPLSLQYASENCRNNIDLLLIAAKLNPKVLAVTTNDSVRTIVEQRLKQSNNYTTSNSSYGR